MALGMEYTSCEISNCLPLHLYWIFYCILIAKTLPILIAILLYKPENGIKPLAVLTAYYSKTISYPPVINTAL
jgi:hypothetical protein